MQIRIVLVGTTHSGNIGSVARAMKTMGVSELYLVAPEALPDEKSKALASNAKDVLYAAKIADSLPEALEDCDRVIGTSARSRSVGSVNKPLRQSMQELSTEYQRVAIVFGRENSGLSNMELDQCDEQLHIPANPDHSSLNIAQAVQVVVYEWRSHHLNETVETKSQPLAGHAEFQGMLKHLESVMLEVEFLDKDEPRFLMRRFKDLFSRAALDSKEVNILRGLLAKIEAKISAK